MVTDNARAEAWDEGHRTGWEHCQDGNYGNDHWDDPTPNPYAAAARAETTTDEECGDYPAPCNCDDPETHDGAVTAADRPSDAAAIRADIAAAISARRTGIRKPTGYDEGWDDALDIAEQIALGELR